jgi:hypothetical protein
MTNYSSPPLPPPEPLGGNPGLETKPGEDPWWWTRFVGEEKWWNQVWFRAVLAVPILAALLVTMHLAS